MTTREDTLDLGHRYFLFGVFAVLTVGSLLTLLLVGVAFNWPGLLVGIVANIALVVVAERLYSRGMIGLAKVGVFALTIMCLLFIALALTTRHHLENWLIAAILASSAAFYAVLFVSSHITVYLADKRGERIDVPTAEGPAGPAPAFFVNKDNKVVLRDELRHGYQLVSTVAFAGGGLLLALSAAAIVGGLAGLFAVNLGDWFGLLLVGILSNVLGMVLITTSNDAGYLSSGQGYEANHLANTLKSLKMFFYLQLGMTALMIFVLLIRWIVTA